MKLPLEEIYQEVILDHNRSPRNYKTLESPAIHRHGYNPLCGDEYDLYLDARDGKIEDVGFQGRGCAISKSSASMMTSKVKGRTLEDAAGMKEAFLKMVTRDEAADYKDVLGSLAVLESVKKFPIRVKCATMIWHLLNEALTEARRTV